MKKIFQKFLILIIIFYATDLKKCDAQWYPQTAPNYSWLNSLYFINQTTAYAVGWNEIIIKTTNAGTNWSLIHMDAGSSGVELNSTYFFDENTGFAAGGDYGIIPNYHSKIMRTTNGGVNWSVFEIDSTCIRTIRFISSSVGFAGGWSFNSKQLMKTTDGGMNWSALSNIPASGIENIFFLNSNTGWAVGDEFNATNEIVLKTTNGGGNWFITGGNIPSAYLSSVFFVNANTGWITGWQSNNGGLLKKSTDGGFTWIQQTNNNRNELYRTYFFNENTGWIIGDNPPIQKTTNGGVNWYTQICPSVSWMHDIYMKDENTGYTVGSGNSPTNSILKTTNGGGEFLYSVSGTVKYLDNNQPVTSGLIKAIKLERSTGNIIVLDSTYIQSNGTYMLTHVPQDSVDIGLYPVAAPPRDYLLSYYPSTIYWEDATILYPTQNLTNVNLLAIRISETTAPNSVNGKVRGMGVFFPGNLKDANIYAKNGNAFVRCAVSDGDGVYHLASLPSGNLKIIATRLGYKADSTNVTVTSTSIIDSVNFYLNRVFVGVIQQGNTVPEKYYLSPNYPNPFNPVTNIKFDVPEGGLVRIKIYNLLGKEVTSLVNSYLSAGKYNAAWNASSFPSGVYFYRMEVITHGGFKRSFVQSGKMILLK